jgi:hypothetical protein
VATFPDRVHCIDGATTTLQQSTTSDAKHGIFLLKLRNGRTLTLSAKSETEALDWCTAISNADYSRYE